jgi:hypothetical protein
MTKFLASAAALALLSFAPAALAATPEMEATFGNTVTQTNADGSEISNLFNEDGTVTRVNADGSTTDGTWTENGPELCTTFDGDQQCWQKAPGKKAGDSWDQEAPDGSKVTISISEGR